MRTVFNRAPKDLVLILATAVTWTESLPNFQDMDYFLKIILLAKKITYLPEALYFYQIRQDLVTISSIRKKTAVKYHIESA